MGSALVPPVSLGTAVGLALNFASAGLVLLVVAKALVAAAHTGNEERAQEHRRCDSRCWPLALHPTSIRLFIKASALAGAVDTLVRAYDLGAFYVNNGVFPSNVYDLVCTTLGACDFDFDGSEVLTHMDHCLHLMSGSYGIQCLLFSLTVVIGVFAAVKPSSSRMTCLYILVSSMHRRNHWINNKGSETLRAVLLWSILLSLEMPREMQTSRAQSREKRSHISKYGADTTTFDAAGVITPAGLGYIFQVSMLYWYSAMYKFADREQNAWVDGSALRRALEMVQYRTATGDIILSMPEFVTETLTYGSGILDNTGEYAATTYDLEFERVRQVRRG
eukprot:g5021.t1